MKTHDHQHEGSLKTHDHQHNGSLKSHDYLVGGMDSFIAAFKMKIDQLPSSEWLNGQENSFELKNIMKQTDLQDNKHVPHDIAWGFLDLCQLKKKKRKNKRNNRFDKVLLYINNTNLRLNEYERRRTIYFQIIDIPLNLGPGINILIPIACNFDYVPKYPRPPKKHVMKKDNNDKNIGWKMVKYSS